jgi:zinc D-Ala-D-Ala carboxypeptidase
VNPYGRIPGGTLVSPHFTFAEMTRTDHRDFLDEQADAPPQVRSNLVRLAYDILEPARAIVGPLRVNSGYRCPGLNGAIAGSRTSRHMDGLAADVFPLEMDLRDAYQRIVQSSIPWDQCIYEFGRWIHLGAAAHGQEPRRQALMIFAAASYEKFNPKDPRFRGLENA